MPAHFDAGDVFAMPCRTRLFGLEVEAFGIVYLEAAACGLPVITGDSGGAPEAAACSGVLPVDTDFFRAEQMGQEILQMLQASVNGGVWDRS